MNDLVDESYNRLVARIAREALHRGFRAGNRRTVIAGWEEDWFNCCYIDTPQGLVSWHYPECFAHFFASLPAWDCSLLAANDNADYQPVCNNGEALERLLVSA